MRQVHIRNDEFIKVAVKDDNEKLSKDDVIILLENAKNSDDFSTIFVKFCEIIN